MIASVQELLLATLSALEAEGKVYQWQNHFFVSTPLMVQHFQQRQNLNRLPPASAGLFATAAPYLVDIDFERLSLLSSPSTHALQRLP